MTFAHPMPKPSSPGLDLEYIEGPDLGRRRWPLSEGVRLGRANGSEVELADLEVSREHARIERGGDGWSLRDCGSQHGTRLNELPLAAHAAAALHAGDVISIGRWRFRIVASAARLDSESEGEFDAHVDVIADLGSLAEQRLALLLACAGEVASASDEQALADALAEHALLGSGYTRAAVLWRTQGDVALRSLRPVAAAGETAFRYRRSLLAAAAGGEMTRLDEAADAPGARAGPGRTRGRALCAPLMLDGRAEAFLYLDATRPARRGHHDAPTFVQALARLAALAIANLHRLDGERERAMLAADIERAREVQRRLLPDDRVPIGGLHHALHLHPGRAVAGDIADVIALPGGAVVALLGDVSGAGLGAGLIMASVQSFLRAEFGHHADPARALARLNRHLHAQASRGQFVTLWLGVFDPSTRSCRFVDAGHGHALRIGGDGEVQPVPTIGSIPLGIDAGAVFVSETLQLERGAVVLLYSDGVIERRAPDDAAFGRGRLVASLLGAPSPGAAVASALAALAEHAGGRLPDDDTTLLGLSWAEPA